MRLLLLAILSIVFFSTNAQEKVVLSGKIINKSNKEGLPNANISLKNSFEGTTSNIRGEFIFKFAEKKINDTIIITYLGFESVEIPILNYADSAIIELSPKKFLINEIIVKNKDPRWIIKKAIENIPGNYPNTPLNITAFYRENIQENNAVIQFAEAVLKIYKSDVSNHLEHDKIKLLKGRTQPNVKKSILWQYIRFVDGPYDLLKTDVTKNTKDFFTVSQNKLNFLNPKHFKYYTYTLLETLDVNNALYAIQFKPNPNKKRVLYDGTIFIDKETFSIIGIEYKFNVDKINLAQVIDFQTQMSLEEAGAIVKAVDFYCFVEYKPYKDKWIFSQATMKYNFVFNEKITKELSYITAYSSLVNTNITEDNIEKIGFSEQLKFRTTLEENITTFDPNFWENYNYIEYEKSNF